MQQYTVKDDMYSMRGWCSSQPQDATDKRKKKKEQKEQEELDGLLLTRGRFLHLLPLPLLLLSLKNIQRNA